MRAILPHLLGMLCNQIINSKISNLPILKNDTDDVIEFNDGFSSQIKNDKPRSFWNLLKFK